MGKRVPGTNKTWLTIASPYSSPKDVAGSSVPPVITDTSTSPGDTIEFFEFPSTGTAAKFASALPVAARLIAAGVQRFEPVAGPTTGQSVPAPVEWYDLQECLYATGQAAAAAVGEPSGGKMNASGGCSVGTASSIGFAEAIQRGKVVAIVETFGGGPILGSAGANGAIDAAAVSANQTYATGTVQLLQKVGIIKAASSHKKTKKATKS
jgi:hypothetical protein